MTKGQTLYLVTFFVSLDPGSHLPLVYQDPGSHIILVSCGLGSHLVPVNYDPRSHFIPVSCDLGSPFLFCINPEVAPESRDPLFAQHLFYSLPQWNTVTLTLPFIRAK